MAATKFAHADLLKGGPDIFRTRGQTAGRLKLHVLKTFATGTVFGTAVGNSCGSIDMVAGDFVTSPGPNDSQITTVAAKIVATTSGTGLSPDTHIAILDHVTSQILYATFDNLITAITSGVPVNVPAFTLNHPQPV